MDIATIDKNLKIENTVVREGKRFYPIPCACTDLYGVFYDERRKRFLRMDAEIAEQVSAGVSNLNKFTSGGRLRFSTNSSYFAIRVTYDSLPIMSHMPISAATGFTLLCEDTEEELVNMLTPIFTENNGFEGVAGKMPKDGKMHNYILHFPLYGMVNSLTLVLDEWAQLENGKKYLDIKPILYYGSSITQGGCASRADASYPSMISKWNGIDFINLGFSGSARAEKTMIKYLSTIPCSLFVCDYDHNAPDVEHLQKTHYALYETFREEQAQTPIIFISAPSPQRLEKGKERCDTVLNTYQTAKQNGDENVWFIDGKVLFGEEDKDFCTVDGCHPNDLGFYRMAKEIYKIMKEVDVLSIKE